MTIDQVSVAIGALQADADAARNQRADLFSKLDENNTHLSDIKSMLGEHMVEAKGILKEHDEDIKEIKKGVSALNKFKQRVYLGVAGTVGTGGVGGYIASKLGLGS